MSLMRKHNFQAFNFPQYFFIEQFVQMGFKVIFAINSLMFVLKSEMFITLMNLFNRFRIMSDKVMFPNDDEN